GWRCTVFSSVDAATCDRISGFTSRQSAYPIGFVDRCDPSIFGRRPTSWAARGGPTGRPFGPTAANSTATGDATGDRLPFDGGRRHQYPLHDLIRREFGTKR